jgi:hypothetical protein
MTDPEDIDLTPGESLLFWCTTCIAIFAVGGFCAGLLYPFI